MFLNPIVTRVINEWFFLKQRFSTYIQQIAFLPVGLVYNTLLEEILAEGNFGGVSRLAQIQKNAFPPKKTIHMKDLPLSIFLPNHLTKTWLFLEFVKINSR